MAVRSTRFGVFNDHNSVVLTIAIARTGRALAS
jgi:hypothetical protein